jgi:flagellar biogenesis protein FliO
MRSLTPIVARLALASLLVSGVAAAVPEPPKPATNWLRKPPPKPAAVETKPGMSPLRVMAMLSLVALLGGAAFYAKRRRAGAANVLVKERLAVISSTRVGPKAHAVVTSVGGKRLLLGVTDNSVNVLAWLDGGTPAQETPALDFAESEDAPHAFEPEPAPASPSGFLRLLRSAVGTQSPLAPADEVARETQDEVKFSRRATAEARELVEGQAAGILLRKKARP